MGRSTYRGGGGATHIPRTLSRRLASIRTPAVLSRIWAKISTPAEERRRLVSVDALRGIAIVGMLLVNNRAVGGTNPLPFEHVDWEGLRFADMVFPWFLFVAGVGMALSMAGRPDRPALKIYRKFASRVVALLAIGLVLNYYKYGDPLRYMGVLQRIALAGALAAPFARKKPVCAMLGAALFLLVHRKLLLSAAPAGVIPGSFGAEGSIAYWGLPPVVGRSDGMRFESARAADQKSSPITMYSTLAPRAASNNLFQLRWPMSANASTASTRACLISESPTT
ncbi:MAG: heparan-alpha-glucosaminide N-acetyltransferase domain-containing protein [Coriobacteriia bacterium]|nr:heparan-alpha-glucosaminide N-acetyltransferase domain-containing protein [Coriobacteriia bacterium]